MLNKLKIAGRLFFGFGVLMLLIAGLAGIAVYSGRSSQTSVADALRMKSSETLDQRVQKDVNRARYRLWMYLANGEVANLEKAQDALKLADERFEELTAQTFAPSRRAKLAELGRDLAAYKDKASKFKVLRGI